MPNTLRFETDGGSHAVAIDALIVAGWTARDRAAVEHHIAELAAIGVPAPSRFPLYYRVSTGLATQADRIEVVGDQTSGEVEPVLLDDGETLWLGLGSDHTDRELEAVSVAASKQACAKVIAGTFWRWDSVADRLDTLELVSWIRESEAEDWTLYQEGALAAIRPLAELMADAPLASGGRLLPGTLMMCGTLGAKGGVRPARHFRMEMRDPAQGRSIRHGYTAEALPVVA